MVRAVDMDISTVMAVDTVTSTTTLADINTKKRTFVSSAL